MQVIIPFTVKEIEHASYHPLVTGFIGDNQVNLILDTGASRTVLSSHLTESFGKVECHNEEAFAAGINAQRMEVEQVVLPSIVLGDKEFTDMTVFSTDLQAVSSLYEQMAGIKIDGLLGSDFLVAYDAMINFQTCEIILNKSKEIKCKE